MFNELASFHCGKEDVFLTVLPLSRRPSLYFLHVEIFLSTKSQWASPLH